MADEAGNNGILGVIVGALLIGVLALSYCVNGTGFGRHHATDSGATSPAMTQ